MKVPGIYIKSAMKYPRPENEISIESARHPYENSIKYPRAKNEISIEISQVSI